MVLKFAIYMLQKIKYLHMNYSFYMIFLGELFPFELCQSLNCLIPCQILNKGPSQQIHEFSATNAL